MIVCMESRKPKSKVKKPKCHRPGRESPKTITTRLYSKWAQVVKALADEKCEVCGRPNSPEAPLNAHHIMPRQYFSGLRFDTHNGVCLCPKCHKMGKFSAHKGGIWFADWLHATHPDRYSHCILHKDDEIDCKDRKALYDIEHDLHQDYFRILPALAKFKVTVLRRDGCVSAILTEAHNKKSAEFIAACTGSRETPVKGILKVERYADPVPQEELDRVGHEPIPVI